MAGGLLILLVGGRFGEGGRRSALCGGLNLSSSLLERLLLDDGTALALAFAVSAFGIGGVQVEGTPCDGNFIFGGGPNLALVCGRGADVSIEVPSERSVRSGVAGLSSSMLMLSSMSDSLSMRNVGGSAGGGLGAPCLGFGLGMFTSSSSVTAA